MANGSMGGDNEKVYGISVKRQKSRATINSPKSQQHAFHSEGSLSTHLSKTSHRFTLKVHPPRIPPFHMPIYLSSLPSYS